MRIKVLLFLISLICSISFINGAFENVDGEKADGDLYEVGVGIADVTGPSADIGMMGYANPAQSARGIHTRLFARTFIVKSGFKRVVFVSVDAAMMDTAIKREVISQLSAEFGSTTYTTKNVLLSGTHTHSGPGGYIQYLMYGIASFGFHKGNFNAVVDGIVESIRKAHHSLKPGRLSLNEGDLFDSNINRSPWAYEQNPENETKKYEYDVDKKMSVLRIDAEDGSPLGAFSWFAVHPVSMNNTNLLISGDNKGYASMLFEYEMNQGKRPGKGSFVAAFPSSNLGDVSPNTDGAKCRAGAYEGEACDYETSTCGNFTTNCIAFGPGTNFDMFESTEIIGRNQFKKAWELFQNTSYAVPVTGPISFIHQYVNMSEYKVNVTNEEGVNEIVKTCPGALGYSFAGGTTDGPGLFDFTQGTITDNPFWNKIRDLINKEPDDDQIKCHAPKPILLNVGQTHLPYDWVPSIVDTQILRIGNIYIVGIPGELTTMSGRRLRERVEEVIMSIVPDEPQPIVIIAGLSNVYTHYVATYQEYQVQRYEGASTLFGPHTLNAYIQQFSLLATHLANNVPIIPAARDPPDFMSQQISLLAPIIVDMLPVGYSFGGVKREPLPMYISGEEVICVFVSGHPRNDPMRGGTFLLVEKLDEETKFWDVIATDADWSTKFRWRRPFPIAMDSEVEISWKTDSTTEEGIYRIRHFGHYKPMMSDPEPYQGSTRTFAIRKTGSIKRNPQEKRIFGPLVNLWRKLINIKN